MSTYSQQQGYLHARQSVRALRKTAFQTSDFVFCTRRTKLQGLQAVKQSIRE